jgi:hypothetical protein
VGKGREKAASRLLSGETGDGMERVLGWTYVFCINRSGRMTPEEKMAPDDLAVP